MKKHYCVRVSYSGYSDVEVEAGSVKQAKVKAIEYIRAVENMPDGEWFDMTADMAWDETGELVY
jgi:hypothetical protein